MGIPFCAPEDVTCSSRFHFLRCASTQHPGRRRAFDVFPSDEMTAMSFRAAETGHCVLGGNACAKIERRSGTGEALSLYPLQPEQVKIEADSEKKE